MPSLFLKWATTGCCVNNITLYLALAAYANHGIGVFIEIRVLERHLNIYTRYKFALNLQFIF